MCLPEDEYSHSLFGFFGDHMGIFIPIIIQPDKTFDTLVDAKLAHIQTP